MSEEFVMTALKKGFSRPVAIIINMNTWNCGVFAGAIFTDMQGKLVIAGEEICIRTAEDAEPIPLTEKLFYAAITEAGGAEEGHLTAIYQSVMADLRERDIPHQTLESA